MELRQLRYFVEIVSSGSISRAAETLHIAQPALSQQMLALERELGVDLLARHARGTRPSEAGRLLFDRAVSILKDVESARELVTEVSDSPQAEIAVGLPTSACRGLMLPLKQDVAARFPRIDLHIVEAMSGALEEWTASGRLDVALTYVPCSDHGCSTDAVAERLCAIVASPARLKGRTEVDFAQFARLPLVLPRRPNVVRVMAERMAEARGVPLNVAMNCDSFPGLLQMVREGYVALMPKFAIQGELGSGELFAVDIVDPTPRWAIRSIVSPATENPRAAALIAQRMQEVIGAMVAAGTWRTE